MPMNKKHTDRSQSGETFTMYIRKVVRQEIKEAIGSLEESLRDELAQMKVALDDMRRELRGIEHIMQPAPTIAEGIAQVRKLLNGNRVTFVGMDMASKPVAPERKAGDRCELPISRRSIEKAKGFRFEYTQTIGSPRGQWAITNMGEIHLFRDADYWNAEIREILTAIPIETVSLIRVSSTEEVTHDEMVIDQETGPDWAQIEKRMIDRGDAAVIVKEWNIDCGKVEDTITLIMTSDLDLLLFKYRPYPDKKLPAGSLRYTSCVSTINTFISRIQAAIREWNAPKNEFADESEVERIVVPLPRWHPQPGKLAFNTAWNKIALITDVHDDVAIGKVIDAAGEVAGPYSNFRPLKRSDLEVEIGGVKVRAQEFVSTSSRCVCLRVWFNEFPHVHVPETAHATRSLLGGKVPIMPVDFNWEDVKP